MNKPHLETLFPGLKLYTLYGMLDALGWSYMPDEDGANHITCCGEPVHLEGWFGAEYGYCKKCGKGFQDMLGILPAGGCTAGMIDTDSVQWDDGRNFSIDYLPWNPPVEEEQKEIRDEAERI